MVRIGGHHDLKFFECSMMTSEEGSDGLVEEFTDLFETELAVVSEFDDFSVGFIELADRVLERCGLGVC